MNFARLVPELICSDIEKSLNFYVEVLGFSTLFQRPEDNFVYLDRGGVQLMLEQPKGRRFLTAPLEHPFGRGMNLQIEVGDVDALYRAALDAGSPIYLPIEDRWYRVDDAYHGNRQFIVEDPDGYLLRLFTALAVSDRQPFDMSPT